MRSESSVARVSASRRLARIVRSPLASAAVDLRGLGRAGDRGEDRGASLARPRKADRERNAHRDRERERDAEDGEGGSEVDTEHRTRGSLARSRAAGIGVVVCAATGVLTATSWMLGPSVVRAAEPVRYDVEATVDRSTGRVVVDLRVEVALAANEAELRFWLYADRLAVAPDAMEERSWRWIFPGEIDLGGVTIAEVAVDGVAAGFEVVPGPAPRDAGGSDLVVALPDATRGETVAVPGDGVDGDRDVVVVTLRMTLEVPDRFGRIGRDGGVISLAAPWYPLLLSRDDARGEDGWAFDVPHRVHVVVAGGQVALGQETGSDVTLERVGPYVPALVAERIHVRRQTIDGTEVVFVSDEAEPEPPPDDAPGIEGLEDLIEIDRVGLSAEVVAEALATARWLEAPLPERIVVTTVPLRTELTGVAPGTALVSDRLFEIFPLAEVREFHRRALRRAVLGLVADEISRRVEQPVDRGWASDLRGVVLLDLDLVRRSDHADRPEDLLALFSFHPAVDQLLYAPQTTFESVYFGAIDEPDRFHDDPVRARAGTTGGRRILECARDVLDEDEMRRFVTRLVRGRRSVADALARIDAEAAARLPGWLAYARREVNYRLGAITSERTDAGTWRHVIELFRDGDERPEPVEVEVEDSAGHRVVERWDAMGERGEVVIETPSERASVTIDPRHHVPESARVADGHPRADDTTALSWRPPIISAFSLDVLASEANVTGLIDFALRQRYDLEHTVSIRLARTAARTGGRILYLQGLGPKVHTNRRVGLLGGGVGFNNVAPGFGGSRLGGWAVDLEVLGSLDSRAFIYDPRGGYSLVARVVLSGTIRDDGQFFVGARGSFRGSVIVPAGLLNAFYFGVGGGFSAGPALDADRVGLGGRTGLRGFANGELLGSGALYGLIEHRWTAVSDLAVNILHLVWAREIQVAWWVGGGVVFDTPARMQADGTLVPGEAAHGALEAGAGLRFHYEYGGIQPGVLAIDFGFPLSRYGERPDCVESSWLVWGGAPSCPPHAPFAFYLGFDQYF